MKLDVLKKEDLEKVRLWRNEFPQSLRTPYLLTKEMQEDYYNNVISNRQSNTRYYGIYIEEYYSEYSENQIKRSFEFIGYGGIESINEYYRNGEISIIINPHLHKRGYGQQAVKLILDQAFNFLNLEMVYGEVYSCANWRFWRKYFDRESRAFFKTWLPRRKYYNGRYWSSMYFCFTKDGK